MQFTSVSKVFLILFRVVMPLVVYPETKGVPLEEMDRVFGEGILLCLRELRDH